MVMMVWRLDLQLPVLLVPIITKVASSNSTHAVYSIQHYVIKIVSDLQLISLQIKNCIYQ